MCLENGGRRGGGGFGICFIWEGGKWPTLGKEGFAWGKGVGKNYKNQQ